MASDIQNEAIEWLAKLNSDVLSQEDEAAFFAWLQQSQQHQAAYVKAEQIWLRGDVLPRATKVNRTNATVGVWIGGFAMACCAALALIMFWPHPTEFIELRAETQIAHFALPDGSEVTLKPLSQLSYAFEKNQRTIRLAKGEVFFDVAHNPARPFIVNTDFGNVRVLGTQFSVGLGQRDADVLVLSGRVEVAPERIGPKLVLTQNQTASFQEVASGEAPKNIKAAQALSWRNNQWVFESTPLAEAVAKIEVVLGAPIAVPHSLASLPVTGVLPMSKPLQALKTLAASHDLVVEPLGKGYQLRQIP